MPASVNDFERETECYYKEEHYSVRDNGAVLRHACKSKRARAADNKWTFGKPNQKTGYMEISSARIHRIIATAFHGEPPTKEHVVDHIDTNKQNNRPENLRWVTRLENILLNPITAKRITLICGSVEDFLADPAKFRDKFQEPKLKWMQSVSIQEAEASKKQLLAWAASDKVPSGNSLDEWIFRDRRPSAALEMPPPIVISETPNAVQKEWKTPCVFPCCPQESSNDPIETYAANLKPGEIFCRNKYSHSIILDFATSGDGSTLWIMCKAGEDNPLKPWSLAQVTYENNLFVHTNLGSYFTKTGVEKQFTLVQGVDWTGEDSIEDYC